MYRAVAFLILAGGATALTALNIHPVEAGHATVPARTSVELLRVAANFTMNWDSWVPVQTNTKPDYGHPEWLSQCEKLYLDIGTNIGVMIRKLFEPEKYPDAKVMPTFDEFYGEPKTRPALVCALGMEPNPMQQPRLQKLEQAYNRRGFRTHIYPFAAWHQEGSMTFRVEGCGKACEYWGAHVAPEGDTPGSVPGGDGVNVDSLVRTVDLIEFILSLPRGKIQVMKLDVEGAEWEILGKGIRANVFCQDVVPHLIAEAHPNFGAAQSGKFENWKRGTSWEDLLGGVMEHSCGNISPSNISSDDETYLNDVDDQFD